MNTKHSLLMNYSPMTISNNAHVEEMITEMSSFSSLRMFGHLFNLHPGVLSAFSRVEEKSKVLFEQQLRHDFGLTEKPCKEFNQTISRSHLEQSLSQLFNAHSPFWEDFYAGFSQAEKTRFDAHDSAMTEADVHQAARNRYPVFFTVIEALDFSTAKQHHHTCNLILLSLQNYLKGNLLAIMEPLSAQETYAQAVQILGPVNTPTYRELLRSKMILNE